MAPHVSGFSPLRAVTQRLTSTPAKHMAHVAPCLAASIRDCKDILSSPQNHVVGKEGSENSVLVHKYKSQLSALLQEKVVEARWAALVLIKVTIEVGGWEVLRGSGIWVRGLLGLLGKPDPITTKKLCIITLTKIILLTHQYQTLVREITTPHLPSFILICLSIVAPKSSSSSHRHGPARNDLILTVLDAFCHLLPRHPTIFRPFAAQIQTLLLPLLAPTPSTNLPAHESRFTSLSLYTTSEVLRDRAQRLFALLHCCAPKSTSGDEWRKAVRTTIADVHLAADKAFRAVIEDWEPIAGALNKPSEPKTVVGEQVSDKDEDLLGLPRWQGISAGIERLCGLLGLLQTFLAGPTSSTISLPLGPLMDMLTRIFSLIVPPRQPSADWYGGPRLNPEVGRDEREGLWVGLPHVHVAALGVLHALAVRLNKSFTPLAQGALDHIAWVFPAEKSNSDIRTITYVLVARLLDLIGPSLTRPSVAALSDVIRCCCDDLLPSSAVTVVPPTALTSKKSNEKVSSINADAFLTPPSTSVTKSQSPPAGLHSAASALLPLFLTQIAPQTLSYPLRSQIDRTAVLTQLKQALLGSVLNPAPSRKGTRGTKSLLPLLVRSYGANLEVEGLLRPRMPILRSGNDADRDLEPDEEGTDAGLERDMQVRNLEAGFGTWAQKSNEVAPSLDIPEPSNALPTQRTTRQALPPAPLDAETKILPPTTAPCINCPPPAPYTVSHKRDHDNLTEPTDIAAPSGPPTTTYPTTQDAPTAKRVRLEVESFIASSSEQGSAAPVAVAQERTAVVEDRVVSDMASKSVVSPVRGTAAPAAGVGGGGVVDEDSDDSSEILPLVMDSDTDEEEEEEGVDMEDGEDGGGT